jgi:hypothetical protein
VQNGHIVTPYCSYVYGQPLLVHGFLKKESVLARRAFYARRSNLLAVKEIASGWKEHPALATTQKTGFVNYS